jgi:tetratricopeptide (TPR) repeat protein
MERVVSPAIENPAKIELSIAVEQVLEVMFAGYRRVVIRKEFGQGLSGARVLEVRPIKADGTPELPAVVKTAAIGQVEKEWQAYQQHIRRRLPYIAEIRAAPVLLPQLGWGGLRYTLMGGGTFEVVTLLEHCRQTELTGGDVCSVLERLFRIMQNIWDYHHPNPDFQLQSSYDQVLPVNLLIQDHPLSSTDQPCLITPTTLPTELLGRGDLVQIVGFALSKVNPVTQTITLRQPNRSLQTADYFLRYKSPRAEQVMTYPVNQIVDPLEGKVIETRTSRLTEEAQRALGQGFDATSQTVVLPSLSEISLPNPLAALPELLKQRRRVNVASIHGDFNLSNILIEPETGMVSLIDFAEAREDHVLHDFLRLETEVVTKILPEILVRHTLPPALTLVSIYQQLHQAVFETVPDRFVLAHPALKKPLAMLITIRQMAQQYLTAATDPTEYYQGLVIVLLGALKFKNLNDVPEQPLPKQLAFWGAAMALRYLTAAADGAELSVLPQLHESRLKTTSKIDAALSHGYVSFSLSELRETAVEKSAPFQALHDESQFVGREQELAELRERLTDTNGQNVYCLTGMGGIGKTALAVRLAHTLRDDFPDGVLWANAAASEPLAILDSWAQAFDYDFSSLPDLDSRAASFRSVLADKKVLMILDNVWSADQIRPLLPGGSRCTVLLTTRDSDLAVALGGTEYQVSVLTALESRRMLTEIVGRERVQAESAFVDEICQLLGNLPLAVKISARRLASRRRWRLADLVERLRDEKNRLAELRLRDQEVRASFAVSWEALDDTLRRIFALLVVFEGRLFRASALAAVAEVDRNKAEDHLFSLGALSLVAEEGEKHYRQHPLLVDFAREHLADDEAAFERTAQYYLGYAKEHQHDYLELEHEWDNLLAGMRIARRRQMWPVIIDYADTLAEAWFARARFSDMRQGYGWACEAARALENDQALAHSLRQRGRACIEQGDYDEAEEYLTQSLEHSQALDDRPGLASAQYYLGRIAVEKAEYDDAQRLLEACQAIREQLGDIAGIAETLYQQVYIHYDRRNLEKAESLARRALDIQQTIGDKIGCIRTLGKLADISIKQEKPLQGEQYCQRALVLCEEIQERAELSIIFYILAEALRRQGNLTAARDYAERSLALLTQMGDRKMQARALWRLSMVAADLKDFSLALEEALQSLVLLQELKDTWSMLYTSLQLGDVHQSLGEIDRAREIWSEALNLANVLQHPLTEQLRRRLQAGI